MTSSSKVHGPGLNFFAMKWNQRFLNPMVGASTSVSGVAVAAEVVGADSTNSPDSPVRQSSSNDKDQPSPLDKPLVERERLSLLRIIRALANETDIDISHPTKAAESISALTAEIDEEKTVAVTTIARHLRRIRDGI